MKTRSSLVNPTRPRWMAVGFETSCIGLLLLWLLMVVPADVQAQFQHTINNGSITITGYTGTGGVVTIPSEIEGLPVTRIGWSAFHQNSSMTYVAIPDSVTSIEDKAFSSCGSLISVMIGRSVTNIGFYTFSDCRSLTAITVDSLNPDYGSVDGILFNKNQTALIQYPGGKAGSYMIPASVTSIEYGAFSGCGALSAIEVDSLNPVYSAVDGVLLDKSQTRVIQYPGGRAGSYVIPNSIESIGISAFASCTNLTSVTIPDGVNLIAGGAFASCTSLSSITLPDSVTGIYSDAFASCTSLTNAFIGSNVTHMDSRLFYGCTSLTSITIPGNVTSIGSSAFAYCRSLTSITLPNNVTSIGDMTFYSCTSLTNTTLGSNVARIGSYAFASCTNLTSVTIPNSTTSIESGTFYGCLRLVNVAIPDGITSIGDRAFSSCTSLTSITIPDSVTSIWDSAFASCASLTNVTIPNSVTNLPYGVFDSCTSLTKIIIGNSVRSIGNTAFSGCTNLMNITLPDSVGSIGDRTFYACASLTNVTIPDSVIKIGFQAFSDCTRLTSITIPDSVTSIGSSAFAYCRSLISITIPQSVTSLGGAAFLGCTKLTTIAIPESVSSIEDMTFYSCANLTNVTIGSSVTNIGTYAFGNCLSLTGITIPDRVIRIGLSAFSSCSSLVNVTIPESVTRIGDMAFLDCSRLRAVYFQGDAPSIDLNVFSGCFAATIYYLPGTSGWEATFGGRPTMLFLPPLPVVISPCFPVATNTNQPEFALSSAFDGARFLIGVRGTASNPDTVGAQLLSPAGTKVGDFIDIARSMHGFLDGPRVVFGATNYLLVWTDAASQHPASGNDVYAQFISPTGTHVGSAFPVSTAPGDQYARGAAFDGTNYLVIWASAAGLRARQISLAGQLLGDELVFTAEEVEEAAAVTYGGGQYFVVWVEGTDGAYAAKGRLVSPAGQLGDVLALSENASHFYNPISVAYGADRFMVVWHHNASEAADWNLRGRLVLPNGTLAGGELFLVDGALDDFAWANNVAYDGAYFLLAWTQADSNPTVTDSVVWGQYWSRYGVAQGSPFIVDNTERSKLGVGLSGANGRILAVINTGIMSAAADVCARIITHPFAQITPVGPQSVSITFSGILQSSTNLQTWMDVEPPPASPWMHQIGEGSRFFRVRAETSPNPLP